MISYPEEHELISLLQCLPVDHSEDRIYHYDETSIIFNVKDDLCKVTISPSYSIFSIKVRKQDNSEPWLSFLFQSVDKVEIISDTKERAAIKVMLKEEFQA